MKNEQIGVRILVTSGPTWEAIDAVRYIGNRSSGTLGAALAEAAAARGHTPRVLLGPNAKVPQIDPDAVIRFESTADLELSLAEHTPWCEVLVMAAAVADYRPKPADVDEDGKRRRTGDGMTLELESTPDLLAGVSKNRTPGQVLVGFALEPRDGLLASAKRKLERKGVDMIVANPLETMDSGEIDAMIVRASDPDNPVTMGGTMSKAAFVERLLDVIEAEVEANIEGSSRGA